MTTSEPILVYLGANAHHALEENLRDLNDRIQFVESAIYPERWLESDTQARKNDAFIQFDADLRGDNGKILFTPIVDCNQLAVIDSVMDDKLLPLLWTRFGGKRRWRHLSEVKRYEVVYSLIKSAIDTCRKVQPKAVVFSYEPHMLPMYVFKKVCKAMGIPSLTMVISPFNWKVFLEEENVDKTTRPCTSPTLQPKAPPDDSVTRFIEEKQSDYQVAKPFYESRIERSGRAKVLLYKLKANGWKPHKMVFGQIASHNYHRLTTPRKMLQGARYVCMFLQLQPEQTTLPDGGRFVHHLLAIQTLYAAASRLNLSLVIREHPATFESAYDLTWRPRNFYKTIQEIGPNIFFDDIHAEPYSLIKNASAVSAITGTVLLEALLQGRPAIAFGKHPLRGHLSLSFIDDFADEQELGNKLAVALEQAPECIVSDAETYLHKTYLQTFGPHEYVGNAQMSLELLRHSRYEALTQIVAGMMASPAELPCAPNNAINTADNQIK